MKVNRYSWKKVTEGVFLRKECSPLAPSGDIQRAGNEVIMALARKHKIPLLLTLDAHFVYKGQKIVQDLALQNGRDGDTGLKFHTKYYQMDTEAAWEKWLAVHGDDFENEFVEGVENNHVLASRCEQVKLNEEYRLPEVEFPREVIEVYDNFRDRCTAHIIQLINAYGRFPVGNAEYTQRLKEELRVIRDNSKINLLPYFLALNDICEIARQADILVGVGRGSAGGCLLAYLLKITHIDPIKYGLSFERFLSEGRINRGTLPDIDIDFSDAPKLAELLKTKYGEKFARICTTGTNKVRGAIRDVSRIVLQTQTDEEAKQKVDEVCKTISLVPQGVNDLIKWLHGWDADDGHHFGELETNAVLREFFEENELVQTLVEQILGLPKSLGRHASAFCLADVPIHEIVPVCQINEEDCTQFTMGPVQKMGLVKFDLLGLNTLKDIDNCIKLIKARHNEEIDIYNLEENEDVFKKFGAGRTETVFQFSGPIPTQLCKVLKPQNIIDLASITAAGRPGTMYAETEETDGTTWKLIDLWVARRQGKRPVTFLHEDLASILSPTAGIVLFQEQISAMFRVSCGYSAEQADEIREIIGKKKIDKMQEILPDIRKRLVDRGWNERQIRAFISLCESSSNYVFNMSHSVGYGYMAYVCMWLKTFYPLEWWTAILQNSNHEDLKKNAKYVSRVVKCPDVNVSQTDFYIIDDEEQKIVYPFTMIKGVKNASQEIIKCRPYESFEDFYNKVNKSVVNKRVVTAMIWSGAFDKMPEAGSGTIAEKRNTLQRFYKGLRKDKDEYTNMSPPQVELLQAESICMGNPDIVSYFCIRGKKCVQIPEAMNRSANDYVSTAGMVKRVKAIKTKKGHDMCFIDLANGEHEVSLTCFPETYETIRKDLKESVAAFVRGKVNVYNERKSIVVDTIQLFELDSLI